MENIIAAVIGGFLAAGTGWFLQWRLEASRINKLKELLIIGMKDDFKVSIEIYDRLIDEWEKGQTIWFSTLNELRESRQIYIKNRDWLVLIKDEALRQKVFRYYQRSADYTNLLENQQRRIYDIQAKLNGVSSDLLLRNNQLSHEQARQEANRVMQAENQEFSGLEKLLTQNIHKIRDFKQEAKDLLVIFETDKNL